MPTKSTLKYSEYVDIHKSNLIASIDQYRNAVNAAIYTRHSNVVQLPRKYQLQNLYKNVFLDTHLYSVIQNRKSKVLGEEFTVLNDRGEVDEEKTNLINKRWFTDFVSHTLDSNFYGYSLIEISEPNPKGEIDSIKLIPRQNTIPELNLILKRPNDYHGIDISDFDDYVLVDTGNLGLLEKVSPLVIYKRYQMNYWSDFSESYGNPIVIGKTELSNNELHDNMLKNLSEVGANKVMGIDKQDEIIFSQVSSGNYQIFDELITLTNKEISKAIVGQTLTTDQGDSGSYALGNVHKSTLQEIQEQDIQFIENVVTGSLFPKLSRLSTTYSGFENCTFKVNVNTETSTDDKVKVYSLLLQHYDIDEEQIKTDFNIDVKKKPNQF